MSRFYNDTMQGLVEAVSIEKGEMALKKKMNMPADTFVAADKEKEIIETIITLRREQNVSQSQLARLTGYKQQAISRTENKEHSPSLKMICNIINALGYELAIVKK